MSDHVQSWTWGSVWKILKCLAQRFGFCLLESVGALKNFQQKSDISGQVCDLEIPPKRCEIMGGIEMSMEVKSGGNGTQLMRI